ncbi:MAG: hypothetical protein ACLQU1_03045 [Bryobacteraceae bacterium]
MLSNVTVSRSPVAARIERLPEMPISGLQISDLVASGDRGPGAFNASGLARRNVRIGASQGGGGPIRDAKHPELDRIGSNHAGSAPFVRLDNCRDTVTRANPASPGTDTFLSVQPGNLKSIFPDGNYLAAARSPIVEAHADYWRHVARPDRGVRKNQCREESPAMRSGFRMVPPGNRRIPWTGENSSTLPPSQQWRERPLDAVERMVRIDS